MYVTFASKDRNAKVDDRWNKVVRVGMTDEEIGFLFPSAADGVEQRRGRLHVSRTQSGIRVEVEPARAGVGRSAAVSLCGSSTGKRTSGIAHPWVIVCRLSDCPGVPVMDVVRRVVDPARRDLAGGTRTLVSEVACREAAVRDDSQDARPSSETRTIQVDPSVRSSDDLAELSVAVLLYNEVAAKVAADESRRIIVTVAPAGKIEVSVTTTLKI